MAKGYKSNSEYPDWDEGEPSERARTQYLAVLARIIDKDHKKLPSAQMVCQWHREMFDGLAPHPDYLGNFRNLDKVPECLRNVNVQVDDIPGIPYDQVLTAVDKFISDFSASVQAFDKVWGALKTVKTVFVVDQMIKLAAWAHGEWVRIHPFINGNGRTSRLWVSYVFLRYGFQPIAVKPRPGSPYDLAAARSMRDRDHSAMESLLWELVYLSFQERINELISMSWPTAIP
jgi:fido (protein-threonine AMPylation protein)